MVIYGNNGTGKTHIAEKIYHWAKLASSTLKSVPDPNNGATAFKNPDAMFIHWPTFLDELKSGAWEMIEDLERASLLILDDVGAAYDPSRVGLDKLCRILSKRERKWTLVTTNLGPDSWEEAFDRRAASRFFRNAIHVDLSNVPDFCTT